VIQKRLKKKHVKVCRGIIKNSLKDLNKKHKKQILSQKLSNVKIFKYTQKKDKVITYCTVVSTVSLFTDTHVASPSIIGLTTSMMTYRQVARAFYVARWPREIGCTCATETTGRPIY